MRKYIDYMLIGIKEHLVYRGTVLASFMAKIVYLYMQFCLWNALFDSNPGLNVSLSHEETIRYIIVATIVSTFMECDVIAWINSEIQSGSIANQLIRPMDFRAMIFSKHMGRSVIKMLIYCIPLTIISVLYFGKPLLCREQLLYGVISIVIAYMIQFLYSLIIGMMAFWLIVTWPLNMLLAALYKLLSGSWIPVSMFPGILSKVNAFLPFRAIYAIPVTIMTSPMSGDSIRHDMTVQLIWLMILGVLSVFTWNYGKKKLIVQGG
ncbi:MAG: ABC-2 family transporter protein [Eubacterium sp.]|nr:ABC-2 family transporter protein [Eubacterium sp.]